MAFMPNPFGQPQPSAFEVALKRVLAQRQQSPPTHRPERDSQPQFPVGPPSTPPPGMEPRPAPAAPSLPSAPSAASGPPPPAASPGDPNALRARATDLFGQQDALTQAILAQMKQPTAPPPQYQAPAPPQRDRGADIGALIGTALMPRYAPAFAAQAQAGDARRQQEYTTATKAAEQTYAAQAEGARQEQQQRQTDLLRYEQLNKGIGDEASRLLTNAEHAEHDRAQEAAVDIRLDHEALKIQDNRARFSEQFTVARERLALTPTMADRYGLLAARQAGQLRQLGVRGSQAMDLAQLRATTQMTLEAAKAGTQEKIAGMQIGSREKVAGMQIGSREKVAGDTNALRREIASDRNLQANARAVMSSMDKWQHDLAAGDPATRQRALAQMQAQMADQHSALSTFKADLQRRGLMGDTMSSLLDAEIRAGLEPGAPGAATPAHAGGGAQPTTVNVNVNGQPAAGASPAPGASAPPPMPSAQPATHAKREPTQSEADAESARYFAAHPHSTQHERRAHLQTWYEQQTGPPR